MSRKNKCSSLSQTKNFKRARLHDSRINILQLSDCTLLNVLQFLDSTSLYQLGQTCIRFNQLVRDESLWIYVEARHKPNNNKKNDYCWDNVNKKTKTILTAGESRSEAILSLDKLIFNSHLKNLTILALENQCIKYCKLKDFPVTLQELSFRKSFIAHQHNFFYLSYDALSNLRVLLLDHCQWLSEDCVYSLAKFPNLEILSFYMCKKLCYDVFSCITVSTSRKFPSIKVFDLRFTDIGDTFIRTYYNSKTLQVVYIQNYSMTYYKERKQRMEDVGRGQKYKEPCYVSDDEDNNLSRKSITKRFGDVRLQKYHLHSISDYTFRVFQNVKGHGDPLSRPKSNLYVYPYQECTCGFSSKQMQTFDKLEDDKSEMSEISSDEEATSDPKSKRRGLYYLFPEDSHFCYQRPFDSCLGSEWLQEQSTPDSFKHQWLFAREPRNDHEIAILEHFTTPIIFRSNADLFQYWEDSTCFCTRDDNKLKNSRDNIITNSIPEVTDESIIILIAKIANIVERIKTSTDPDREVLYILKQIFDSLQLELASAYYNDLTFICRMRVSLLKLIKNVCHKIFYVLRYHFECFKSLLIHLQFKDTLQVRKQILARFFNNLMLSEVRSYNNKCKNKELKWNMPGTSGCNKSVSDHVDIPMEVYPHKYVNKGSGRMRSNVKYSKAADYPQGDGYVPSLEGKRSENNRRYLIIHETVCNSNIKELSLRGYEDVTNESLLYLKNLELELLDVTGTNVTLDGLHKFMLSNPLCRVLHKFACVCKPSLHF